MASKHYRITVKNQKQKNWQSYVTGIEIGRENLAKFNRSAQRRKIIKLVSHFVKNKTLYVLWHNHTREAAHEYEYVAWRGIGKGVAK